MWLIDVASSYTFEDEDLVQISIFNVGLSTFPVSVLDFKKLRHLSVAGNSITSLPSEIEVLEHLQNFSISCNKVEKIPEQLFNLKNLTRLCLFNNPVGVLSPSIKNLDLKELEVGMNGLTFLPPEIGDLTNLTYLDVGLNKLKNLPKEITNLIHLEYLDVSNNLLTTVPSEIAGFQRLTNFYYYNNPLEYIPPQIRRLAERLKNSQKIYDDKQSVHNSHIQKTFRETVFRLANKKPELGIAEVLNEIEESELKESSKRALVEYYMGKDVHSGIGMTYSELLVLVWDRIRNHCHRKEILSVLDTEVADSKSLCFTGRITRLVNCLNGFDTDVIINISENEQLSNLMVLINNRYDNLEEKKQELFKAMKERGFSKEKIDEWVGYID
jgi:hypothetical protein